MNEFKVFLFVISEIGFYLSIYLLHKREIKYFHNEANFTLELLGIILVKNAEIVHCYTPNHELKSQTKRVHSLISLYSRSHFYLVEEES